MKPISLQLYTLRAEAAEDFFGVLRTVAEIGYKGVELGDLYGHSASEVAAIVQSLGMQVSADWPALPTEDNIKEIATKEKVLGNTQIVCGFWKEDFATIDACRKTAARIQTAAQLAKNEGLTLSMHNHWWEFLPVEGQSPFDILMEEAPDFQSELDIYWAAYAGADPLATLARYGARIPLLHVKDGLLAEDGPMTAVGSGKLDIPGILGAANPDVLQWLVVELDRCDTDMTEAVRQSYAYLTGNGLAAGNK